MSFKTLCLVFQHLDHNMSILSGFIFLGFIFLESVGVFRSFGHYFLRDYFWLIFCCLSLWNSHYIYFGTYDRVPQVQLSSLFFILFAFCCSDGIISIGFCSVFLFMLSSVCSNLLLTIVNFSLNILYDFRISICIFTIFSLCWWYQFDETLFSKFLVVFKNGVL